MIIENKNIKLYKIILLVFFALQLTSSLIIFFYFKMKYTGIGFGLSSILLPIAYIISRRNRLTLSVVIISQIFPIIFTFLSIVGKLNNEGTSLVYYIAPRFGILVVILIPFLVFGTKNKKKLLLTVILPIMWFVLFDYFHSLFNLNDNIEFNRIDYPLVIIGSTIILILSILMLYFLQSTNEAYEKTITEQREDIEKSLLKISDSINYAQRIQKSLLKGEELLSKYLAGNFIIFRPKETVSGDFYWIKENHSKLYLLAADCTGHGVPGAFVSMLGFAFLNEIFIEQDDTAAEILEKLRYKFKEAFKQQGEKRQDGMDAAFCIIDFENNKLNYAGAHNPLIQLRNDEISEYKATANSIGFNHKEKEFQDITVDIKKQDKYFIFSDGYADQTGGDKMRKITKRTLKELFLNYNTSDMNFMKTELEKYLEDWMMKTIQVDDILVIGIEI